MSDFSLWLLIHLQKKNLKPCSLCQYELPSKDKLWLMHEDDTKSRYCHYLCVQYFVCCSSFIWLLSTHPKWPRQMAPILKVSFSSPLLPRACLKGISWDLLNDSVWSPPYYAKNLEMFWFVTIQINKNQTELNECCFFNKQNLFKFFKMHCVNRWH